MDRRDVSLTAFICLCVFSALLVGGAIGTVGAADGGLPIGPIRGPGDDANNEAETNDEQQRLKLSADEARIRDDGSVLVEGNVQVDGADIKADADSAVVDEDRIWVRLVGNVTIDTGQTKTSATGLQVNIDTEKWKASHARTQIRPEFFQGGVREPLYITASKIRVREDKNIIDAFNTSASTCSKKHPHYALRSDHVAAVPGKRVVFEEPSLYIAGNRIFKYPLDFVLSLRRKDSKLIPEIGENQVEGKYAKFAYPYRIDGKNDGLLRLHLTEKRGTGYGFDHYVQTRRHAGKLSFFYEPSENAMSSSIEHRWWISDEYRWRLHTEYQENSGYSGTNETFSGDWRTTRRTESTNAQLGMRFTSSGAPGRKSRRFSSAFSQNTRLGNNANWRLQMRMKETKRSGDDAANQELDTDFEYDVRGERYDYSFAVDNRFDLDRAAYQGDESYRATNHLPKLTFRTTSDRIGWHPLGDMPLRMDVELEHLQKDPEGMSISRAGGEFNFGGREHRLTGDSTIRTSGRYWQSFYDEGSAAYATGLNAVIERNERKHWSSQWRLNYSTFQGNSPVRTSYWGSSKNISYELAHLLPDKSRFSLSTGYDLIYDRWDTALVDYEVMTSDSSKLSLDTGYDIENEEWRSLRTKWQLAHPQQLYLTLGTHYDIEESELRQGTIDLDWRVDDRTRLEFLGRYSGRTNDLSQMDVRLTRDMHCWMGSVSYNKPTGNWQVTLWLKALERGQLNFGSGRGAQFQSGAGMYY